MSAHKHPSYIKIYIILLALFAVSVAGPEVAEILGLEGVTRTALVLFTAFGIAIVKAYYVCAYFMHLKFEKIYAPYILLTCLTLVFIFFFGVATDIMKAEGKNWDKPYDESIAADEATARGVHGHGDHGEGHGEHGEEESETEGH